MERTEKVAIPKLSEALRADRTHLVGVAVFPFVAFFGDRFHIPFPALALLFFASALYAMWPCFMRRAPYSFWLVACAIYLASGALAVVLVSLLGRGTP
jgi:hypothetical protein